MNQTNKIRVAVLYGGNSAEHEVSVRSAANVIEHLDQSRFEIIPIGIDKSGNWFLGQDIHPALCSNVQSRTFLNELKTDKAWFIGKTIEKESSKALLQRPKEKLLFDVVFPVVHGVSCEDGTLQGLLELANLPYVGAGVLSSAIGMDKDVSKRLAAHAGINVAPCLVLKKDKWLSNEQQFAYEVLKKLAYPVFVKPANTGSSIGITKVKAPNELQTAINEAFCFDVKVLVEKALDVIELEVAILESLKPNQEPIVSEVGEIRPTHEFYSYTAKYEDENGAQLLIPAPISKQSKFEAQAIAKKIFNILECEGMARVDLFLEKDSQQIYFNEINTIPGFTQISMYPKLMAASGINYSDLLTHLIELAIKRHKYKNQLIRSYSG